MKLEKILEKKAIIFDLDGTILNSEPLHAMAFDQILLKYQRKSLSEKFKLENEGKSDGDVFSLLFPKSNNINDLIEEKNNLLIKIFEKLSIQDFEKLLTPGFYDFLKKIPKDKKIGIVTASTRKILDYFIAKSHLSSLFSISIAQEDTKKTKPDPMPYLFCFEQLKIQAQEAIIFEDSRTGLAAATESLAEVVHIHQNVPHLVDLAVKKYGLISIQNYLEIN